MITTNSQKVKQRLTIINSLLNEIVVTNNQGYENFRQMNERHTQFLVKLENCGLMSKEEMQKNKERLESISECCDNKMTKLDEAYKVTAGLIADRGIYEYEIQPMEPRIFKDDASTMNDCINTNGVSTFDMKRTENMHSGPLHVLMDNMTLEPQQRSPAALIDPLRSAPMFKIDADVNFKEIQEKVNDMMYAAMQETIFEWDEVIERVKMGPITPGVDTIFDAIHRLSCHWMGARMLTPMFMKMVLAWIMEFDFDVLKAQLLDAASSYERTLTLFDELMRVAVLGEIEAGYDEGVGGFEND